MSVLRPLGMARAGALAAALAATTTLAAPRLDLLLEVHRTEAVPTTHGLLLARPAPALDDPPTLSAAPSLVQVATPVATPESCPALLRHSFTPVQGGVSQSLCQYQGRVVLVVNTASKCGYTYQYEGLEALYRKFKDRGLVVLGFPSDDFGGQEPGSNREIAQFCRTVYGVQFPMFEKASVTRVDANPFYAELVARTGQKPRWNFHKYLIDRSGTRVASFGSNVEPGSSEFVAQVERLLAEKPPAQRT